MRLLTMNDYEIKSAKYSFSESFSNQRKMVTRRIRLAVEDAETKTIFPFMLNKEIVKELRSKGYVILTIKEGFTEISWDNIK